MTNTQAVRELLQKAEALLAQGDARRAAGWLDQALQLDFTNARAWQMLHQMLGKGQPFEIFQRDFVQKNYPERAYLLEPIDLIPPAPSETAPVGAYAAESSALNRVEEIPCPACRHRNEPEARFCAMCGASLFNADEPVPAPPQVVVPAQLPPAAPHAPQPVILQAHDPVITPPPQVVVPEPPSPQGNGGTTCPNCGRINPRDARLCAFCGYDFFYHRVVAGGQKEKPVFRFHFVDLGDLVVVISLFLPWSDKIGAFYIQYLLNVWGAISDNTHGMGAWIVAYILLALGATILVRARHKLLAVLCGTGALVSALVVGFTLYHPGPGLAILGAFLVLLGVIFFDNKTVGQWLGRHKKAILLGIVGFFVLVFGGFFVFGMVQQLQNDAKSNANSTQWAKTGIVTTERAAATQVVRTQNAARTVAVVTQAAGAAQKTAEVKNQTATAVAKVTQAYLATKSPAVQTRQAGIPAAGADFKKYQLLYINPSKDFGDRIYLSNADGSGSRQAVDAAYKTQDCPRFSPDRSLIAFSPIVKAGSTTHEVWIANGDGSNPRRLSGVGDCPVWSPDGQYLAFFTVNGAGIYRIKKDGSGLTLLKDLGQADGTSPHAYALAWSPDGKTILYAHLGILYAMDAGGGNARPLTSGKDGKASSPAWSPDGNLIVFSWEGSNRDVDIYLMNKDGSNWRRLTFDGLGNFTPFWSPDGAWLGFTARAGNSWAEYMTRADGSGGLQRIPLDGSDFIFAP